MSILYHIFNTFFLLLKLKPFPLFPFPSLLYLPTLHRFSTFPFPSFPFPSSLPSPSTSLPSSLSLPVFPILLFPSQPSPFTLPTFPPSLFCCYLFLYFFLPLFLSFSPFSLPFLFPSPFFHFSFPSPLLGSLISFSLQGGGRILYTLEV